MASPGFYNYGYSLPRLAPDSIIFYLGKINAGVDLRTVPHGEELLPLDIGQQAAGGRPEGLHRPAAQKVGGAEHLPAHHLGEGLHPVDLVLRDLAEDKIPQLLRFVAKVEDAAVLTDDAQHLLADVNDQLGLDDGVIARAHHAHLLGRS